MALIHDIVPFEGESFSHYWGRYSRHDLIAVKSAMSFGIATRSGSLVYRWARFFFNPRPTEDELEAVCEAMVISRDVLLRTLPDPSQAVNSRVIRLCAACYAENPWHLMLWQYQSFQVCSHHGLKLLGRCPGCQKPFLHPFHWQAPMHCMTCGLSFARMKKRA